MEKIDVVFCVLTYKNHQDLVDFIKKIKEIDLNFSYKILVVNNYADEHSYKKIKKIALLNNCVFLESENKGYGSGNNLGISYARSNYKFNYLIVCNPDIEIIRFDFSSLKGCEDKIVAPDIKCLNGKKQNPLSYKYMPYMEKILYIAFSQNIKLLFYLYLLINKFYKYFKHVQFIFKKKNKIYACHGSFIIFGFKAIDMLYPVFDEKIFLYCEESDLARKARKMNVDIIYNKDIVILHKEDGSMKLSNANLSEILRESYLYYYTKWNCY